MCNLLIIKYIIGKSKIYKWYKNKENKKIII